MATGSFDGLQFIIDPVTQSITYPVPKSPQSNSDRRKFQLKDEVIVKDPKSSHAGKTGKVAAYDFYAKKYQVKFPGSTQLINLGAGQLAKMPTFKVGDRVMVPRDADAMGAPYDQNSWVAVGGTIVAAAKDGIIVQVDQGEVDDDWGRIHNGLIRCWGYDVSTFQFITLLADIKIKPKIIDFDTVVIAEDKRRQILEALEQIHQADLIFNVWGFGKTMEKGKGVSMLFYGLPGTGKTLMGQAIAEKLGCELKIINTADIESSEPGQAERNIRDVFKNAVGKKVVLLFDECDSLVFDRSTLGPILGAQVNELLSSLEKYDGVTIFTTNRIETLDEAVNRRLALKLEFEMPNEEQRQEIWKRMFPPECPLAEDVDLGRLARVEIAGGHIKNAVLRSARIAALQALPNPQKKIHMAHLVRALSEEGKSMLAFHEAKKKFNVAGYAGGGARMGAHTTIEMDKMSDVVERLGDAYA